MRRRSLLASAIAGACLLGSAGVAQAETIEVTTTSDPVASTCPGSECSLRQAVAVANPGDVIQLAGTTGAPSTYKLTRGSQIVLSKSMTIQGNGVDATTVDGSANHETGKALVRMLKATAGTVNIKGLRFTGGDDGNDENFESCSPCLTLNANGGGALFNSGATVTLEDVDFDTNGIGSGQPLGGAISNSGTLEMKNVLFKNDDAAFGGGLFSRSGTVIANGVTFEQDGSSAFDGGAVFLGGGIVSLVNMTIVESGRASSIGGGIDNKGATLTLLNDTLSGNVRGALQTDTGGSTSVQNTILGSGFADEKNFNCIAAGENSEDESTPAKAITTDLGNNIDQDGACGLNASGDKSETDPKLAPIAENGGPTATQALLHASPAIDAGNDAACPAIDQRGTSRPQGTHCDIGAFEAVLLGAPTATTESAQGITATVATLEAKINLTGEAGGFRFQWGLSEGALNEATSEAAAGVISSDTAEGEELSGLNAHTTYFYKAVADNASASTLASNVKSFTTPAAAPQIIEASATSITETTAKIDITINPGGADTEYRVEYGPSESYGEHTEFVDIGSASTPQEAEVPLAGLEAERNYHFDVVAKNSVAPGGVHSEDRQFTTEPEGGSPEGPQPGPPLVSEVKLAATTPTSATIEFSIDPDGADTEYVIKYGPGSPPTQETSPVDIGATPGLQHITRTLTGLEPGKTYSFEVLASNSQAKGAGGGGQFTTAAATSPLGPSLTASTLLSASRPVPATLATLPLPILGKSVNVELVSGKVLIALPAGAQTSRTGSSGVAHETLSKGLHFIPLTEARQIPVGSTLETTAGVARIETATSSVSKPQLGDFGAGIFKLLQQRSQRGLTELNIVNNLSSKKVCATLGKGAAVAAKLSSKVLGRIHGSAHGRFVTKGRYSAATVRGTIWSVSNQCNGTLTKVTRDVVTVRDFRRRKTITLLSGQSYLARAPGA